MSRTPFYSVLAIGFAIAVCPTTLAQSKDQASKTLSPLTPLYSCAKEQDAMTRLKCYDNIVASLHIAEEKKEIVAIDASVAKQIKKEAFGFNLPSLPKLGLPKIGADKDIDAVTLPVKSIKTVRRKYLITFENGQVWEQSGGRLNYVPRGDLTATIKPKALGSYMLSISNGSTTVRGLRVRRVK